VSSLFLNNTSAQLGCTVPFRLIVSSEKIMIEIKAITYKVRNSEPWELHRKRYRKFLYLKIVKPKDLF